MTEQRHDEGGLQSIRFLLNGASVELTPSSPTQTVLQFLRDERHCKGTKEGCAEGDCGACTVVLGERQAGDISLKTVNACIQVVPMLDGKALFTVEGLRQPDGWLHPVQQAMVDCHASQCGFCTPGFVMSLWALYEQHGEQRPAPDAIRSALTGNLCRCTGYRPILEAGERMFEFPAARLDRRGLLKALEPLQRNEALALKSAQGCFFAPRTLAELIALRKQWPKAVIVAGNTDVGLWINKQLRDIGTLIYIGEVSELKKVQVQAGMIRVGAGVTLSDTWKALADDWPQMNELWERFASMPIRNAATLGGNIANGSPIGDAMPALIAVGAKVVLIDSRQSRTLALEDLYLGYQQKAMHADEVVVAIEVPLPVDGQQLGVYKVSKRYDSDISAVCAAFMIQRDGERLVDARIAFGGMAAVPKRASRCESVLLGAEWTIETVRLAIAALEQDFTPLSDMRASAGYRLQVAQNLLYRFFMETLMDKGLSEGSLSVFAKAVNHP